MGSWSAGKRTRLGVGLIEEQPGGVEEGLEVSGLFGAFKRARYPFATLFACWCVTKDEILPLGNVTQPHKAVVDSTEVERSGQSEI